MRDIGKYSDIIGRPVDVIVDRPLGSYHPRTNTIFYTVNYGYVEGVIGGDGHDQDVYILGVDRPLGRFSGVVVAVIHRLDDVEDKWVAAPNGLRFTREQITEATRFVEQFFTTRLYLDDGDDPQLPR